MPRKTKTIYLAVESPIKDLAASICSDNNYDEIIELILAIDETQTDWEFTRMLKHAVDKVAADETLDRIDSAIM